jgi:hypothetical protein
MFQHGGKAPLHFAISRLIYIGTNVKFQVYAFNFRTQPFHYENHQSNDLTLDAIHAKF